MSKAIIILGCILTLTVLSCNKDSPAIDFKYNFYPLALQKVLIYDVDSTAISSFTNTTRNFKFQIKDSVANTFIDATNRTAFRIERYKKLQNETVWKFQKTISRLLNTRSAQENIGNNTFIRLVFPPELGTSWNGNSKNSSLQKEFSITKIFDSFSSNNLSFSKTIITHFEEVNLIREDIETYTYAQDVGLIASDVRAVDVNISNQRITNGFFYTMKLVAFR